LACRDKEAQKQRFSEEPIVAVKRFGHQLDDLKRELSGSEHINACSFITPLADVGSA
jgi:hypothetical protein